MKFRLINEAINYNKINILQYQQKIFDEAKKRKISLNPRSEDGINKLITFMDELEQRVQTDFNLPNSVTPSQVVYAILENKLDTLYFQYEKGEEETSATNNNLVDVLFLNGSSLDSLQDFSAKEGWSKTPEVVNNLKECVDCLERLTPTQLEEFKNLLLIKNRPYVLTTQDGRRVGNINSGSTMVANSIGDSTINNLYFIEIRVASSTNANYRAFGGIKNLEANSGIKIYITSLYTKNGKTYDADMRRIIKKFYTIMRNLGETFMKSWVKLNELLQPKTMNEALELDKFTEAVNNLSENQEVMSEETAKMIKQIRKESGK